MTSKSTDGLRIELQAIDTAFSNADKGDPKKAAEAALTYFDSLSRLQEDAHIALVTSAPDPNVQGAMIAAETDYRAYRDAAFGLNVVLYGQPGQADPYAENLTNAAFVRTRIEVLIEISRKLDAAASGEGDISDRRSDRATVAIV